MSELIQPCPAWETTHKKPTTDSWPVAEQPASTTAGQAAPTVGVLDRFLDSFRSLTEPKKELEATPSVSPIERWLCGDLQLGKISSSCDDFYSYEGKDLVKGFSTLFNAGKDFIEKGFEGAANLEEGFIQFYIKHFLPIHPSVAVR